MSELGVSPDFLQKTKKLNLKLKFKKPTHDSRRSMLINSVYSGSQLGHNTHRGIDSQMAGARNMSPVHLSMNLLDERRLT